MNPNLDQRLSALMCRAQDGDRVAYEAFLREAVGLIRAFVQKRLRNDPAVEDVVQETLLALHHYRHAYDPERSVLPWMYAIAQHRLVDHVRKRNRRHQNEVTSELVLEELAAPEVGSAENRGALSRVFGLLTRAQQEVIHLLKLEGYTVAEIAEKTGKSESAVKVTAHRGYEKLRKHLVGSTHD